MFGAFDSPDGGLTCPGSRSTTPLQAFNLLNSDFMLQQAELLADRVSPRSRGRRRRPASAARFRPGLAREPDDAERPATVALARDHGLVELCRLLFNANEFLFVP